MNWKFWALAALMLYGSAPASAAYVTVYGGPTYTSGVGGYKDGWVTGVNDAGAAIGNANKYDAADTDLSLRAVRWDPSGTAATELGNLGADIGGVSYSSPIAINDAGTIVGVAERHDGSGAFLGVRAVRWEASGTVATELANLGTDGDDYTWSGAHAINEAGTIVGKSDRYDGLGEWLGDRAVRWDSTVAAAAELNNLGTDSNGYTSSSASAVNNAGTAVGYANKYDGSGNDLGVRAVRWDALGAMATELGNLGTDTGGYTYSVAEAINNVGTTVGGANKYNGSGEDLGFRAVRWDASSTVATELGNLGTDPNGVTYTGFYAINDAGTIVGYSDRYNGSGEYLDNIAVRWDASGTAATALGNLGTDPEGLTDSTAFDVNNAGIVVGYAAFYDGSSTLLGDRAVYWDLDGVAVDLNTLVDPLSGWTLEYANFISDTGWIAGSGTFDPDGPGGQDAYQRLFLLQAPFREGDFDIDGDVDGHDFLVWQRGESPNPLSPSDLAAWQVNYGAVPLPSESVAIPEPSGIALLALAVPVLLRRQYP